LASEAQRTEIPHRFRFTFRCVSHLQPGAG
jgi:hypothetical protein